MKCHYEDDIITEQEQEINMLNDKTTSNRVAESRLVSLCQSHISNIVQEI